MDKKVSLDSVDFKILKFILEDARTPYAEIARRCGLAGATIQQRIKSMQNANIIKGMRALVNPDYLNLGVCAFVNIKITQPNMLDDVINTLKTMPEVVECHGIMGQFTLLVKLYCRNNAHLMELVIDSILKIPGVADTSSYISLRQFIDHALPVFIDD
jgi:Lrp/AsnC family transcriptional regulator for asnA, asnC and gidA